MAALIERLSDLPSHSPSRSIDALVAESERAGLRFLRGLIEEWTKGANRFDRPGEALFDALTDGRVIGAGGLNVDRMPRRRRSAGCATCTSCRPIGGPGLALQLVGAVIEATRGRFDTLRLRTESPAASRLYEKMGFRRCAGVADCTHLTEPH